MGSGRVRDQILPLRKVGEMEKLIALEEVVSADEPSPNDRPVMSLIREGDQRSSEATNGFRRA